MIWDTLAFDPDDMRYSCSSVNDITTAVVAKNLLTPKDNRLLSKRSDELAIKDSLALNVYLFERHLLSSSSGAVPHTEAPNDQPLVPPLSEAECSLVERDSGIALHHLQMSESRSSSDEGSPSSSSRFELAMLESSGPLLEKGGTNTKKGKTPMLVPVDDILFHKGARKHLVRPAPRPKSQDKVLKITASKKAEAEAIECAVAIVVREERRLLPHFPTIDPIFPLTMEDTDQEGGPSSNRKRKYQEEVGSIHWKDLKVAMQASSFRYVNNCLAARRSTIDELGESLHENESNRDRMMRLSSYVMIEYDDRLRKVKRHKAKFKKNNQLVNDARKTSKTLVEAIRLKDQNFESLKKRNGENVRLKKQLEGTEKQLETTILEVSKVKGELDSALVKVSRLKRGIPTERNVTMQEFLSSQAFHNTFRPHSIRAANFEKRKWMAVLERFDNGNIIRKYYDEMDEYRQRGEAFILAVDPSSEGDSDNEASVNTEDGGDGDGVETQSDIVRGSASDEDDS
ncbi:hypothetical protein D8674_013460 [Pyrus ussuriensis x Pyrus communis]|uniref:Uncharacterized protein n=1 Tax=Pyrus ussuriensis x Pyrus communis TaxID=2448454 RepID=A0A5N5GUM7_9ROSA|nr:hypothetical protein D8674_013460 [Pyrus ussuriensis x Pyrus communis]